MALPANALLTVAEAKEHLRIKSTDTQNDGWIETLIGEASDWIEGELDRPLRYQPSVVPWQTGVAWVTATIVSVVGFVAGSRVRVTKGAGQTGVLTFFGTIDGSPVTEVLTLDAALTVDSSRFFDTLTTLTVTTGVGGGTVALDMLEPLTEYETLEAPGYAGFGPLLSNVPGATIEGGRSLWHSRLRPILRVVAVSEDPTQVYTVTLQANLDYVFNSQGRFSRLNTRGIFPFGAPDFPEDWGSRFAGKNAGLWAPGLRAVRLIYAAGFDGVDDVPARFKNWCGGVVNAYYRGRERKDEDLTSKGDSAGSYSKAEALFKIAEQMKAQAEQTYSTTFEAA